MRGPLKFLTLLALPFTGLVANAFPTPDNRLEISIAITENGGDFTPSENHLITAPESMVSSKNYELNGQNDVHISVDSRPWAYHKIMLDISGRIDEGYNFEALVFVGEGQAVRGNCKDGYDIAIKLPTAHGNLRLSIENNGNDLVGRGRVFVTPGPVIDINDVFLGDLTGSNYALTQTHESQKALQASANCQNWRFQYSPWFIMEGYIIDGVYLHAWVTVGGVRSEEIVGDLRDGVSFRLDVPLVASGEIFFYLRDNALWAHVDVNGPIGRVNFDRPIANLESYGRIEM